MKKKPLKLPPPGDYVKDLGRMILPALNPKATDKMLMFVGNKHLA